MELRWPDEFFFDERKRTMAQDDNHDLLGEADLLYDNGDYGDAFRIYRELADRGDVIAQGSLGWMYSVGHGVEQDL